MTTATVSPSFAARQFSHRPRTAPAEQRDWSTRSAPDERTCRSNAILDFGRQGISRRRSHEDRLIVSAVLVMVHFGLRLWALLLLVNAISAP